MSEHFGPEPRSQEGSYFVVNDDVCHGDLVCFECRDDGMVGVRRLYGMELDTYPGVVFRFVVEQETRTGILEQFRLGLAEEEDEDT